MAGIKVNIELALYYAIAYLSTLCDSQREIAETLDLYIGGKRDKPNRPYVQLRVYLAGMPLYVKDEYILLMTKGKKATYVRWSHIKSLYCTLDREQRQYPEGSGPEFRREWLAITKPVEPQAVEPQAVETVFSYDTSIC